MVGAPLEAEPKRVFVFNPRNTVRQDQAIRDVSIVVGRAQPLVSDSERPAGKAELWKHLPARISDSQHLVPIHSRDTFSFAEIVQAVESRNEMIDHSFAENIVVAEPQIMREV